MGVAAADEENIEVSEEDVQMIVTYISGLPNKEFDGLASYNDSDVLIGSIKLVNTFSAIAGKKKKSCY